MATPTEYDFTQQVDYPDTLTSSIEQSAISTPLAYISTVGSGPTMTVAVWFTDVLSDTDVTTLSSVMAGYVNAPSTNNMLKTKVLAAQVFGQQLILQIEIDNLIAGLTTAQVTQMLSDYSTLISMLSTGSLVTALAAAMNLQPVDGMTQARIDNYIAQIKVFLGIS